jgi:hypothetical protein
MKYISISFIVFAFIVYPVYAQQTFEFDVKLQKTVYYLGEYIDVGLSVINNTNATVRANLKGSVKVNLINEKGEYLDQRISVDNWSPSTREFSPKYEDYHLINLNDNYGKSWPKFISGPWNIEVGTYTLEIQFSPPQSKAKSIKLNFDVKYPEGEEKLVYTQLSNAISDFIRQEPINYKNLANSFEAIHKKYPQSLYTPLLLVYISGIHEIVLKDKSRGGIFVRELIDKYPMSSICSGYVLSDLKTIRNKKDRIDYLKDLQLKSKNTLMEKFYKNLLLAQQTANN